MLSAKIGYFRPNFTPRSVANLAMWYDGADASTFTLNGSNVSQWSDKSGNSRHAVQATASNQPAYGTWSGSLRALDNTDFRTGFMSVSSGPGLTRNIGAFCVSAAIKVFHATNVQNFIQAQTSVGNARFRIAVNETAGGSSALSVLGRRLDDNAAAGAYSGTPPLANGVYIITGILDYANASAFLYRNGALIGSNTSFQTSGNTSNTDSTAFQIMGLGSFFYGQLGELVAYTRHPTGSERLSIERYLANKWGVTLAPTASNADAQSWINRVYANGGTVSTSTAAAVNNFCDAIDSAGIRDRFYRLNLFAGTGLASALVPLYRGQSLGGTQYGGATDTNSNFVAGDYSETSGLKGNGSNKHLLTGLLPGDMGGPLHQAFSIQSDATVNDFVMGCDNAFDAGWTSCVTDLPSVAMAAGGAAGLRARGSLSSNQGSVGATILTSSSVVRYVATSPRTSGSGLSMYQNGTLSETRSPTYATHPALQIAVFGGNRRGTVVARSRARLSSYSIGLDITAGQAAAYNAALVDFLAALGRATA